MGKTSKKNKKTHNRKRDMRRYDMSRCSSDISSAGALGAQEGVYCRVLSITDESRIRATEQDLSAAACICFRAYMLKHIHSFNGQLEAERPVLYRTLTRVENLISYDDDECDWLSGGRDVTLRSVFAVSLCELLCRRVIHDLKSGLEDDLYSWLRDGTVSKRFLCKPGEGESGTLRYTMHVDGFVNDMYMKFNWDKVLPENNFASWFSNSITILESVLHDEALQKQRERSELYICEMAANAAKELTRRCIHSVTVPSMRCDLGCFIPNSASEPLLSGGCLTDDTAFSKLGMDQDSFDKVNALYAAAIAVPEMESDMNTLAWADAVMGGEFDELDAFFAALLVCHKYKDETEFPAFALNLIENYFEMSTFDHSSCAFFPDTYDECLVYNLAAPRPPTESEREPLVEYLHEMYDDTEDINEADCIAMTYVSPLKYIKNKTGIKVPSRLVIPLDAMSMLLAHGYSEREAAALCGYIAGCNGIYNLFCDFAVQMESFETDIRDSYAHSAKKEFRAEVREEVRAEVEEQLREEIDAAGKRAEAAEADARRLKRESRIAEHSAQRSERLAGQHEDTIEDLKRRIAALERENADLQNTVLELSERVSGEEDDADGEEPASLYPSDIGKDVKINVFGGGDNWVAEQRRRFPYVNFSGAETLPNEDLIVNSDILILNTFAMKHKYFWLIQGLAKQYGIPMRFVPSKGINAGSQCIIQVYEQYQREAEERA